MDIASIPGGPLIPVICDYAGFNNTDPARYSEFGQFAGYACGAWNYKLMMTSPLFWRCLS